MNAARLSVLALGLLAVACPPPAPAPREPRIRVVASAEGAPAAAPGLTTPAPAPTEVPRAAAPTGPRGAPATPPSGPLAPVEPGADRPTLGRCTVEKQAGRLPAAPGFSGPAPRWARFRALRTLQVGHGYLHARFSPDGRALLVHSDDEAKLRVYEAASGQLAAHVAVRGMAQFGRFGVAVDAEAPHAEQALVAAEGALRRVDTATGVERAVLHLFRPEAKAELEWTRDHAVLGLNLSFIPAQRSELSLFVRREGGLVEAWRLACRERIDGFSLDDRRERLLLAFYPSNEVALHDLTTLTELWSVAAPRWGGAVALSPDGTRAAVGGEQTWLLDAADPARRAVYAGQRNNASGLLFSPDGSAFALGAYDGKARLFAATLQPEKPLAPVRDLFHLGAANVYEPAFSPDGTRVVTASGDKTVRVWGE